jgi:hypothetical protein
MRKFYDGPTVKDTEAFSKFNQAYQDNLDFLDRFIDLRMSSGRIISFITKQKKVLTFHCHLLENSLTTLENIKSCCLNGGFADANSLARRLRDDLLLYVYILAVINQRKPFTEESLQNFKMDTIDNLVESFESLEMNTNMNDDETAVEAWLTNTMENMPKKIRMKLGFSNYMQFLRKDENVENILTRYKLEDYWETLTDKLNNYLHNNGIKFTMDNNVRSGNKNLEIYFNNINIRVSFIMSFFLVLITMIESALLCSGDIEDYLSEGEDLPEDCQYEIAPFIQEYIDDKVSAMHPELKQYLKDNNNYGMKIE